MSQRLIAFYLPQYHPIPENDAWWGRGFTDWTMVARARPVYPGHHQPHLPADLGFYDLRLGETRVAQAELAREFGIDGFCYFHYWFHGKQLLERPFNEVLASGRPDFPFCLCWANEGWARTWDGRADHVLIGQTYSPDDDRQHMRWLAAAFQDSRYIRVEGKPIFLVYNASSLPDPIATTTIWREEAIRLGVGELMLCKVHSHRDVRRDPQSQGFDAAVCFEPDTAALLTTAERAYWPVARRLNLLKGSLIVSYSNWAARSLRQPKPPYRQYPCVTPSWDNSARRESGAFILHGATPASYERWLRSVVSAAETSGGSDGLVFVNAWNEWGEGNHLEPCQGWGRGYLQATRRACANSASAGW
jgi:lipopolysaccharide biosynthesis protein